MAVVSQLIGRDELNANALKEFGINFDTIISLKQAGLFEVLYPEVAAELKRQHDGYMSQQF